MAGSNDNQNTSSTPGFNTPGDGKARYRPDVRNNAPPSTNHVNPVEVSAIKLRLENLHKILMTDQTTEGNRAVHMEMTLPANLVVDSTNECPAVCAQQDVENYMVVLTWGGGSTSDQQECKCLLHGFLSGTHWKISKVNIPRARNGAKKDGEPGNKTMECAEEKQFACYISGLELQTLDETLKELSTKVNGPVHMKMTWFANSGKGKEPLQSPAVSAQQDIKNYHVVLTWDGNSNFHQQGCKCMLSGTNWKISSNNPPGAVVRIGVKEESKSGDGHTQRAEGEQSKEQENKEKQKEKKKKRKEKKKDKEKEKEKEKENENNEKNQERNQAAVSSNQGGNQHA